MTAVGSRCMDITSFIDPFDAAVAGAVSIAAWFAKNVLLKGHEKRVAEIRKEWLFRLREIYCPLFYWSGVILFDDQRTSQQYGADELGGVLAKAAYLIPRKHYYTLVKLVEWKSKQKTRPVSVEDYTLTRAWLYSQIETYNFALFRKSGDYEVEASFSLLSDFRRLWRLVISGAVNLFIWLLIVLLVLCIYWAVEGNATRLILMFILLLIISGVEVYRRLAFEKEILRKLRST